MMLKNLLTIVKPIKKEDCCKVKIVEMKEDKSF